MAKKANEGLERGEALVVSGSYFVVVSYFHQITQGLNCTGLLR